MLTSGSLHLFRKRTWSCWTSLTCHWAPSRHTLLWWTEHLVMVPVLLMFPLKIVSIGHWQLETMLEIEITMFCLRIDWWRALLDNEMKLYQQSLQSDVLRVPFYSRDSWCQQSSKTIYIYVSMPYLQNIKKQEPKWCAIFVKLRYFLAKAKQ